MPSGHKAFLVHNPGDVDLLLMHNKTFAAEYVQELASPWLCQTLAQLANHKQNLPCGIIEEEGGHRCESEAVGGKGNKREGSGYYGVLDEAM